MWKRSVVAMVAIGLILGSATASAQQTGKFDHRTKDNADLYDAVANTDVPEKHRIVPWIIGLICGSLIMGMGLKHSYRNRFEG